MRIVAGLVPRPPSGRIISASIRKWNECLRPEFRFFFDQSKKCLRQLMNTIIIYDLEEAQSGTRWKYLFMNVASRRMSD
jgi:hypothetical protein